MKNLFAESLIRTLKSEDYVSDSFKGYSVKDIIEFLEFSHQRFINESIPKIEQNFLLLIKYFEGNNELSTLFKLFLKFQVDFINHIEIEEKTIFPYSKTLYQASVSNSIEAILLIHFSEYSVSVFSNSHKNNEQYLTEIIFMLIKQDNLKNHPVYNILLKQICSFDNEIKTHGWLEDNVLVEKVEEIERAISIFINQG